ncbi:phage protein Gp37 [Candidatus Williamhamiltonella defendens]|uniref:phage protein Gp37 n=1 Tax=Candidatus Williamhamiltonella defendens TaxID=138072 RepID=UPI00158281E6|nr:phage protein Gp37 [Candidatus Hamiltonella defensa]
MKLTALRQAIMDKINAQLTELKAVAPHPGRFNLDELKRIATQLPAVRVALMGMPRVHMLETGENEAVLRLAAFVVTGDRRQLPKDEAALAIVESLLVLIPGQRWGVTGTMDAKDVKADNLFSGQVERQGVAMWAVTWEQSVRLGKDVWDGGILPSTVYVSDDVEHFGDEMAYDKVLG